MRKWVLIAAAVLALGLGLWALAPYLLPTTVLLPPCGRDWTSPSSYLPRASPTLSLDLDLGEVQARVCYGSPSASGRVIFGGLVPWDEPWRTGANEPTRLFTDGPLLIAGITIPAGRYSLYTVPGRQEWQVYVNRSTFHWGNDLSASVRRREIGQSRVPSRELHSYVEQMLFLWQETEATSSSRGILSLEWEQIGVDLPVEALR